MKTASLIHVIAAVATAGLFGLVIYLVLSVFYVNGHGRAD